MPGGDGTALNEVYVAFGSNLGRRRKNIATAVDLVGELPGTGVVEVSSLYETEPVGYKDQGWFLNGVLETSTGLAPRALMRGLSAIELEIGRRRGIKDGPRAIDLDILFFGDLVMDAPELTIPHPRLHLRRFVLAPLAELAPGLVHPVLKKTAAQLLDELPFEEKVLELGPL